MRHIRFYLTIALLLTFVCGAGYAGYDLGTPVPLDTRPITAGSTGWFQSNPAVASSGSIYLAVWVDMRDAGRGSDLYAARIAANGTVLDPFGIRLTTGASVSGKPDVCWNGQSFFIVYADNSGTVGTQIKGLRVSPDGIVLDASPIVIVDVGTPSAPHVAWNGTYHLVVWISDTVRQSDFPMFYGGIYSRTVSLSGSVSALVRTTYAGSTTGQGAAGVSVACSPNGENLIVWSDDRNSATTSTDLYGSVQGEGGEFVICTDASTQEQPDCCWAGGQFLVVWTDSDSSYRSIRGRRVSTTGSLLDPTPLIISFVTQNQFDPQVAWNGDNCLVTWTRAGETRGQFDIYAGRVYFDGTMLDGSGVAMCTADDRQMKPCVASLSNNFLVCWMDSRSGVGPTVPGFGWQIRGIRVYATGLPGTADFPLTQSAPQHKISCSAYNGRQFLVCFDEWNNGVRNLCGEVIDAYTGTLVTSSPIIVEPLHVENSHPAAVWNGRCFVVTWLTGSEDVPGYIVPTRITAVRIGADGAILERGIGVYDTFNGTTSTPMYVEPAIASDGNGNCRVVFRSGPNVHMVSMFPDGPNSTSCSDTVIATSKSNAVYESPAVCWTGERYVVAWKQAWSTSPTLVPGGIDYLTVSADGVLSPLQRITDTTFPDYFKLACNGQNVLLAAYGPEIRARRLSLTGTLLDTTPLTIPGSADADSVSLAWNGASYVLTWMSGGSQDDMRAIRISADNQLVDAEPITVNFMPQSVISASACAGPRGRVFLAYSCFEPTPYNSTRAWGMYLDESLNLTSLSEVKGLFEGAEVSIPAVADDGPVVSALFRDNFYLQESRSFGIGVRASAPNVATGDRVAVTGRLLNVFGEPYIHASSTDVVSSGNPVPKPVGMTIRNLGGVGPGPLFPSVEDALGLYNVGLLVKVFGRISGEEAGDVYLDDGSKVDNGSELPGVRVRFCDGNLPSLGSTVQVTGISSSYETGGKVCRLIRAIDWSPITPAAPGAVAMAGRTPEVMTPFGDGGIVVAWNAPANVPAMDIIEYHVWRDSTSTAPVAVTTGDGLPFNSEGVGSFGHHVVDTTASRGPFDYFVSTANHELGMAQASVSGISPGASHQYWVSCLYRVVGPEGTTYWETTPQPAGTATYLNAPVLVFHLGQDDFLSDVTFQWDGVPGADLYRLEVSNAPSFPRGTTWCTDIVATGGQITHNIQSLGYSPELGGTQPGTTLYWRIGARKSTDSPGPIPAGPEIGVSGPKNTRFIYSMPATFRISELPPPPP